MARKRSARVHGPYKHGDRWRIIVVTAGGKRTPRSYSTEAEAQQVRNDVLRTISGSVPVKEAIELFQAWLKSTGVEAVTLQTSLDRLNRALGSGKCPEGWQGPWTSSYMATPVSMIATKGKAIYERLRVMEIPDIETRRTYAVSSHRGSLSSLKRWGAWLVDEGLAKKNPFEKIKPVGRARKGKPQLRVDESRQLIEICIRELASGDANAILAVIAFVLGLRATETSNIECRDVDDGGRLVWVATGETDGRSDKKKKGKTDAARRKVEVPEEWRPILFSMSRDENGKARPGRLVPGANRYKVHWHVKRLCRLAGVPVVSPQGLRGTHSTLATADGATGELVMAQLGQAGLQVGRDHYINQDVARAAISRKVSDLLALKPKKDRP